MILLRPLDLLNLNINRPVTIIVKRNQRYLGNLAGFDEHLNLFIENARSEKTIEADEQEEEIVDSDDDDEISINDMDVKEKDEDEDEMERELRPPVKVEEEVGNIVLRGDNIIFLKFDRPNFGKPPHPRQDGNRGYRQGGGGGYQRGGYRDGPQRRDRGYQDRGGGYNRDRRPNDRDNRPRGPPQRGNQRNDRERRWTPRDKEEQ